MASAGVPTAEYRVFDKGRILDLGRYLASLQEADYPIVIKADGLCAGKGAMICHDYTEAFTAVCRFLIDDKFGAAGQTVLVEEFLRGDPGLDRAELSIMALVDVQGHFIMLPPAQDYKTIDDGDKGENTGGDGAFAPIPWVNQKMMAEIGQTILAPVIAEMKRRGTPFSGALYAGLMWTAEGPKVVEFNVRFGDPEFQPISRLLQTDLIPILKAIADGGSIADVELKWTGGYAVCVVIVSKGYPGEYQVGWPISGLGRNDITQPARFEDDHPLNRSAWKVFHAGTRYKGQGSQVLTAGGRVLNVVKTGKYLADTATAIYEQTGGITWGDNPTNRSYRRHDIALGVPKTL
jgi:phosphoribosylamine--glycine ligase